MATNVQASPAPVPNVDEEVRIPDLEAFVIQNVTFSGKKLGDGSYGSVEEAETPEAVCAVKRIHDLYLRIGSTEDIRCMRNAFVNECRLMSSVCHPHLVRFLGICYTPGSRLPALVMEKLETSLHEKLETEKNISLDIKLSILVDVAKGLAYLHGRSPPIIHRDLTARNILITTSGVAKITDLGMAKIINLRPGQKVETMTKGPGNAFYMPPEASEDHAKYSTPIDVFSFGHAALFTGTQKFPDLKSATYLHPKTQRVVGRTEVDRREDSFVLLGKSMGKDHPYVALVKQCLHNIPEKRPSAVQLLNTLESVRTASPKKKIKVMIHGANMTGSTSLFLWIGVGHIKPLTVATIYPDYFIKDTVADGDPITVMIIDTPGVFRNLVVFEIMYRGSDAVMLVYDITNYQSFEEIRRRFIELCKRYPDAIFMLVGNKCDLAHHRQVSEAEGKHFAEEYNMLFYETSAHDSTNVHEAFTDLITEAYRKKRDTASESDISETCVPQNLYEEASPTSNIEEEVRIPDLEAFVIQNVTFSGKKLGDGSYGSVEEAEIPGAVCAVKQIHDLYLRIGSAEDIRCMRNAFVNECRLMSSVCHPHLVRFLGICYTPGSKLPALVMEKLETSLHEKLETEKNISLDIKLSILVDVAKGLAYLHGRSPPIIHRDLTARNILITTSGVAKIADLGMAKIINLRPGQRVGTMTKGPGNAFYMPPEASEDHAKYSTPIDVFSFGHAALFTGTQKFPDLKSATYVDPKTRLVGGRTEVDRREDSFVLLDKLIGKDHPCIALMKQCLHNIPEERPTAVQLLKTLEDQRHDLKREGDRAASSLAKRDAGIAKVMAPALAQVKSCRSGEGSWKKQNGIYQKPFDLESKPVDVVVYGFDCCGVSSLIYRFSGNTFTRATMATIGVDFRIERTVVDGDLIRTVIWDSPGQDRFSTVVESYLKRADGVMLVYDITQNKYFMDFRWKIENLRARNCPDAVFMLVGNKCDLADRREVPEALGRKYAEENNMLFYETSALDSTNVNEAFTDLIKETYRRKRDAASESDVADNEVHQSLGEEKGSSGCLVG